MTVSALVRVPLRQIAISNGKLFRRVGRVSVISRLMVMKFVQSVFQLGTGFTPLTPLGVTPARLALRFIEPIVLSWGVRAPFVIVRPLRF